jgi:hypothetical protein
LSQGTFWYDTLSVKSPTLIEIKKIGFLNFKNPKKLRKVAFGTLEDHGGARKVFLG